MSLIFEERLSDSPFVERVWRSHSDEGGNFISLALSHWQMVVWDEDGKTRLSIRGPETKPTATVYPAHGEFVGVVFKLGTLMPHVLPGRLVNTQLDLPDASRHSCWLHSSAWQFPTFENVDTFINRLAKQGMLIRDPVVDAALQGQPQDLTLRTIQRRFVQNMGMTHGAIRQIERAREATLLLKQNTPILDVVDLAGYADQPHLTRAIKQYTGQTPAQIQHEALASQMSFLFKTETTP
ncbi:MAG: helix-turn-helix domain-containing protein [Aggregatilineales bacterium]